MKILSIGIPATYLTSQGYLCELIIASGRIIHQEYLPVVFAMRETRVIVIEEGSDSTYDIERRYYMKSSKDTENIELIASELEDDYSDDSLFNISSWGADLSFRELVSMYEDDELVKPELQRKYVWDKFEASRFIESVLLGLPVPSIFLAQSGSQKLIVDGYQRIMTVYDYIRGVFTADQKVFRLSNSERINARWRNKAFSELSTDDQRKIKSTTIHAIVFEQKKPENDDTSLYQVFERINTSGRTLTPQEIRNCVYQGTFNTLLFELNENSTWRGLFGTESADTRMRDIEYILRFFVLKVDEVRNSDSKQISLKKSLNDFMYTHKKAAPNVIRNFKEDFEKVILLIAEHIGNNAFHNLSRKGYSKKFHPAIYDAIMIATFLACQTNVAFANVPPEKHKELLEHPEFKNAISKRTTDLENIRKRIYLAGKILYGVELS